MAKLIIKDIPPYDGEYDIDLSYFTNAEFRTIKKLSGVRAGELEAALDAGDNDLVVAFAAVALQRAGKPVVEDVLWNAETGRITIKEDAAADAVPPSIPSPQPEPSVDGNENSESSGTSSSTASDDLPETPPGSTGAQD